MGENQQVLQSDGFAQGSGLIAVVLDQQVHLLDQLLDAFLARLVAVAAQQKQNPHQCFQGAAMRQRILQAFDQGLVQLVGMCLEISYRLVAGEGTQCAVNTVKTQLLSGVTHIAISIQGVLYLVGKQLLPGQQRVVLVYGTTMTVDRGNCPG
ncbi:hypothetical protein D3C80_1485800 [compost metagenome]